MEKYTKERFVLPESNFFKKELQGKRVMLKNIEATEKNAKSIFEVVDKNREHLEKWLPWAKKINSWKDLYQYLKANRESFKMGDGAEYGIYFKNQYTGSISVEITDMKTYKVGEIGYWLSEDYMGNGLVTESVRVLEKELFENNGIDSIRMRCDSKNSSSSSIAEKNGYIKKGKSPNLFGESGDIYIFAKSKDDYNKEKIEKLNHYNLEK